MRQIEQQEPIAPRRLNGAIPKDLETIVLKCMAKNVTQRYQSAQQLGDGLGRFLDRTAIQARRWYADAVDLIDNKKRHLSRDFTPLDLIRFRAQAEKLMGIESHDAPKTGDGQANVDKD